jgi:hypothetical protein
MMMLKKWNFVSIPHDLLAMKISPCRILYSIALPGIVLTFLVSCQQTQKRPLSQGPAKAAPGLQYARYEAAGARQARVAVKLNGDEWAAKLHYHGEELDSVEVVQGGESRLGGVMAQTGATAFAIPASLPDSARDTDLTQQWVSGDFEEGGRLITEDINFDGHPDLLVYDALHSGASNQFYDLWVFDPAKKDYFHWDLPNRNGLGLWDIDRAKRTLTLGFRASEEEQVVAVYKIVKDTAVKLVRKLDTRAAQ